MCLGGGKVSSCPSCKQEQMYSVFTKFWRAFKAAEGTGRGEKCVAGPVATVCVWEKKDGWSKYEYEDKMRDTHILSFSKLISVDGKNYNISFSKTWPQPRHSMSNSCFESSFAIGFTDENGQSLVDNLEVTCADDIVGGIYKDEGDWEVLEALRNIKGALEMITGELVRVQVGIPWMGEVSFPKDIEMFAH